MASIKLYNGVGQVKSDGMEGSLRGYGLSGVILVFFLMLEILAVERFQASVSSEEDPTLEPVRKRLGNLIFSKNTHGNAEDLVQLLKSALLSLSDVSTAGTSAVRH
jgi:hypothetical protein